MPSRGTGFYPRRGICAVRAGGGAPAPVENADPEPMPLAYRGATRSVRDRQRARRRGHGRGLQSPRHPARSARRDQGARPGISADAERLGRFEQEARAAAALNHPHILAVHDVGRHDDTPYIVSELLEGETLRDRLAHGALPPRKAIEFAIQFAHGLAAAHERGIVHRDLKPENIFVTSDGRIKILDFGLAKLTEVGARRTFSHGDDRSAPTRCPGIVMGTIGYMAPEQVRGLTADHRADIFALGAILYEMLSGRRAFAGPTAADTMTAILKEDPPDLPASGPHASLALDPDRRPLPREESGVAISVRRRSRLCPGVVVDGISDYCGARRRRSDGAAVARADCLEPRGAAGDRCRSAGIPRRCRGRRRERTGLQRDDSAPRWLGPRRRRCRRRTADAVRRLTGRPPPDVRGQDGQDATALGTAARRPIRTIARWHRRRHAALLVG